MEFHETGYGHNFFTFQLPKLIKAIDRLAAAIETANQLKENKEEKEDA